MTRTRRTSVTAFALIGAVLLLTLIAWVSAGSAYAQGTGATPASLINPAPLTDPVPPTAETPAEADPNDPTGPTGPTGPTIEIGVPDKPSESLIVLLGITVLSIAPALLALTTSFTKIIVVLSLTRNALGVQNIPPNQVLAGLALVMSIFVMSPVLSEVNEQGIQPYADGTKTQQQAWDDGTAPLKEFMLAHTREDELAMFIEASDSPRPETPEDVSMATLVPAFVISELKSAFIIGFVIFLPFLLIDLVVSSSLMSLGMMMMPPVLVSLPFKLLLFVLVDGWVLISHALLTSY